MKVGEFFDNLFYKFLDWVFDRLGIHAPEAWEDTYLMNERVRYSYYVEGIPPEYALLACYPDPVWDGDPEFSLIMWDVLETMLAGKCVVMRISSWDPDEMEWWKERLSQTESVYVKEEEIYVVSDGMDPALRDLIAGGAHELYLVLEVFAGDTIVGANFEDAEESYTIGARLFFDTSFGEHWGAQFAFRDPADRERTKVVLAEIFRKYGRNLIESRER